jgi:hypothetical protein
MDDKKRKAKRIKDRMTKTKSKKQGDLSDEEKEFLGFIAEMIVSIIIEKTNDQ